MENSLIREIHNLRKKDIYLNSEIEKFCKENLFPENTSELVLSMSNVTSSFYGLALKNIIDLYGKSFVNTISEKIFYDLGHIKTQQCKAKLQHFPQDTTAFALVVISAIYTSSPEYHFEIIKFSPEETIIKIDGIDRYLRILSQLDIDMHIQFPVLNSFANGIKNELQLDCEIESQSEMNNSENRISATYKFSLNDNN